jgi:hypothetical protein
MAKYVIRSLPKQKIIKLQAGNEFWDFLNQATENIIFKLTVSFAMLLSS